MTDTATDEAPTTAVRLWCHQCKTHVPIRPSRVVRAQRAPTVHHVTPTDWTAHRTTHVGQGPKES